MAKKITLKNKNGDVLCPHTAIEQVQGLKEALDNKLGKTEKAVSAKTTKVSKSSEADPNFALSFYAGQAAPSTTPTADKVYVGSSTDGSVISVPALDGSTSMANYMNLRMSFNSKFFHEIAVSPNNNDIYHRNVRNGNALEWKQLLEGLVTTSKIADTAITPAKIQTSIALNGTPSMTVEPTTSSPDKTIASVGLVKKAVDGIEIDTRNLLSDSEEITIDGSALTSGSKYITKKLPISVAVGDVLTFNCEDLIINAGTDQTHAILLYSGGALASVKYISPTSKTATITVTKASSTPYLYMYAGYSDDSAGKSITYKGATLVKGNKPMLTWQAAPEDLPTKAGVINLISASDLELGAIADATGANSTTTNANRARTAGYIPVTSSQLALKSWTDGVVFYLWTYDANKNPIQMSYSSTGWISSGQAYTLPEGTAYIRFVLKKNSGANFTVSELPTIKIKAEYSNKTTDWYPSLDDVKAAARPTVYKQSTQPSVLTAHEGDIWIVS